uniref:Uncharacterized protein n=1 Tax=Rhipicephalus microplus TaxID=6941 RepID=A0A6G5AIR8_RHIMP
MLLKTATFTIFDMTSPSIANFRNHHQPGVYLPPYCTQCVICVGNDLQVFHLSSLAGKAHCQHHLSSTVSPSHRQDDSVMRKVPVTLSHVLGQHTQHSHHAVGTLTGSTVPPKSTHRVVGCLETVHTRLHHVLVDVCTRAL